MKTIHPTKSSVWLSRLHPTLCHGKDVFVVCFWQRMGPHNSSYHFCFSVNIAENMNKRTDTPRPNLKLPKGSLVNRESSPIRFNPIWFNPKEKHCWGSSPDLRKVLRPPTASHMFCLPPASPSLRRHIGGTRGVPPTKIRGGLGGRQALPE